MVAGYDLRGQKTSLSDPDSGDWSYTYDGVGNLITQTNETGTLWFDYGLLSRPTERRVASGTTFRGAKFKSVSEWQAKRLKPQAIPIWPAAGSCTD